MKNHTKITQKNDLKSVSIGTKLRLMLALLVAATLNIDIAARLENIEAQYLEEPRTASKTGEQLYWLTTGSTGDQALIALKPGVIPAIDPRTLEANFRYVNFNIHHSKVRGDSYVQLPDGLYYWNKPQGGYTVKGELQVRPSEKILYLGAHNQDQQRWVFSKINVKGKNISAGQEFDPLRNPLALGDPSRETSQAYAAGTNILHPFDEQGWARVITGARQSAARRPAPHSSSFRTPSHAALHLPAAHGAPQPQQQAIAPAKPARPQFAPQPQAQAANACPVCTFENAPEAKTCDICGTLLQQAQQPAMQQSRRLERSSTFHDPARGSSRHTAGGQASAEYPQRRRPSAAAAPAHARPQKMEHCAKCWTLNPANAKECKKCHYNLTKPSAGWEDDAPVLWGGGGLN